jgi:tyrosine-protein phosphatase SIW14
MKFRGLALIVLALALPDTGHAYVKFIGDLIVRGSQPNAATIQLLKSRGVKSVVNLRRGNATSERGMVERAGLNYKSIPIKDRGTPTLAQVLDFLNFATDPRNQPVFVHCQHGVGRTGIMVAAYAIAVLGTPVEEAVAEAKRFNMGSKKQQNYIRQIAPQLQQLHAFYQKRVTDNRVASVTRPGEKIVQIYFRNIDSKDDSAKKEFEDQAAAGCKYRAEKASQELQASSGGKSRLVGGSCDFQTVASRDKPGSSTVYCRCSARLETQQGNQNRALASGNTNSAR